MKLLILDWDGVFDSPRTSSYRPTGQLDWVDPVAVWHANVFIQRSYKVVIASTRRKDSEFRSPTAASMFMRARGFDIAPSDFFPAWRTGLFVGPRAEELSYYFEQNSIELSRDVVVFDDEDVQTELYPNSGLFHLRTDAQNGWTLTSTLQFVDYARSQWGEKF